MKKLIIINGTMGVGKSTICKALSEKLEYSVWLDGDWCWMMNPWVFSDENKKMVLENIILILRNYLKNPTFRYVIFGWVIHEKEILETILEQISDLEFELAWFSLICSENVLEQRMKNRGNPDDTIKDSVHRLENYKSMDSIKINTELDVEENIRLMKEYLMNHGKTTGK